MTQVEHFQELSGAHAHGQNRQLRFKLWTHKFVEVRLTLIRVLFYMETLVTVCRATLECNLLSIENDMPPHDTCGCRKMHLQTCWAQVDLRVRLGLVPALAFNVMHMQDGHLDLLGKNMCPQALLI